jgi:hypothetical protein
MTNVQYSHHIRECAEIDTMSVDLFREDQIEMFGEVVGPTDAIDRTGHITIHGA